jgi:ribosomal protein S18 acetylase RimI-like enzyme
MMRSDIRSTGHVDPSYPPPGDWQVLRDAVLECLTVSANAFLIDLRQVVHQTPEFWQSKLGSAQWAVVRRGEEILGIAAAKAPAETDDYALPGKACFIESVWIDPELRQQGVGERLVTYLIDQQRQVGITDFYLWVVNGNDPAIRLYERMQFKQTPRESQWPETQFLRRFDSSVVDGEELRSNAADRAGDQERLGITYRLLSQ